MLHIMIIKYYLSACFSKICYLNIEGHSNFFNIIIIQNFLHQNFWVTFCLQPKFILRESEKERRKRRKEEVFFNPAAL